MKKIFTLFAAAILCASVNATVYNGNCGDSEGEPTAAVTWSFDDEKYVLEFTGTGAIKTFSTSNPTVYPWYTYITNIQQVVIGEGITNVPDWAFAMYENLVSVTLPSTLKTIGNSALEECAFTSIYLPEGLEAIGHYAFFGDANLSAICLPSTVTSIGEAAFMDCDNLAYVGCYAVTAPTLGNDVFGTNLSHIVSVSVPAEKVEHYKGQAGWSNFDDKIKSPAGNCGPVGHETDATWAFDMTTHTLTISGTGMIDDSNGWESPYMGGKGGGFNPDNAAGYPCGIKHVVIEEGITAIGPSAFYMEVGLVDVVLPSTLTDIYTDAFSECKNLAQITCNATTPPTCDAPDYTFYDLDEYSDPILIAALTKIVVPASAVEAYKAADGWKNYIAYIEGSSPTGIDETVNPQSSNRKFLRDGQLLIEKNGKVFNAQGVEVN